MQGRLLPKYLGRYQAHPVGYWEQEFAIAQSLDLSCIEFIVDYCDIEKNPFYTEAGIAKIEDVVQKTGVSVRSVCADYFMEAPLHSINQKIADCSIQVLKSLLSVAARVGVKDIVIPCVDQSSFRDSGDVARFCEKIQLVLDQAFKYDINLSIESDLPPQDFRNLLDLLPHNKVTVNYDCGNSASMGYDVAEEFQCYGDRISDVHVKDRLLKGRSVILGSGNVNWTEFFSQLDGISYNYPLVMQVYRDEEGKAIFKEQLIWLKNRISNYNESRLTE